MASTIQLKTGTSGAPSNLTNGEVAINVNDGLFYYGSGSGNVTQQLESFTHITASGNISSSGNVIADKFFIGANETARTDSGVLLINEAGHFGQVNINRGNLPKPILLSGNVTASGNISSSGNFDLTGNANIDGHLDVDGTTNLDVVDVDGAFTIANNTKIQGENDSGAVKDIASISTGNRLFLGGTSIGTTVQSSTANMFLDSAGDITIDSDSGNVYFKDDGTTTIAFNTTTGHITASGNISASGYVYSNQIALSPDSATQAAIQNGILNGKYSLFVGSGSSNTSALIYSDSGHAELQLRSNTSANAQILFNEDGSARYIMGHYGSDDSFQIRNSSFMTGGDQLFTLAFDGSGLKLGHDANFHVTASGNISASGDIHCDSLVLGTRLNANQIHNGSVGNTEFGRLDGLTGNIQTQLDTKAPIENPSFTGTASFASHITASGNISASGTLTAGDGSGNEFTVRPNLYFFATNTGQLVMNGGSDFGSGTTDNQGSLPETNTTTVTLSQEQNSHTNIFSLSSNRLTIARAGLYKITYNATLEINNGSNRAEGFTGIVQETSGGTVTLVDGSEGRGYHRFLHSTPPSAQTYAASVIVNVAADSIYDLRFGMIKQSLATQKLRTIPTGTSFLVEAIT